MSQALQNYMAAFGGGPTPGAEQRINRGTEPVGMRGQDSLGVSRERPTLPDPVIPTPSQTFLPTNDNPNANAYGTGTPFLGNFANLSSPAAQSTPASPAPAPTPSAPTSGLSQILSYLNNPQTQQAIQAATSQPNVPAGSANNPLPTTPPRSNQSTQGLSLATNQLNPLQFQSGGNWNYGGMSGAVSETGWLQKNSAEEVAKMMGGKLVQGVAPGYDMRAGDGNPLNEWLIELPDGRRANAAQLGKFLEQGQNFARGQGARSDYFMQDTINQALANGNFFGQTRSPYGADTPGSFDTIEERNRKLQNQANNLPPLQVSSQVGATPTGSTSTPQAMQPGAFMQQQGYRPPQGTPTGQGYTGTGQGPQMPQGQGSNPFAQNPFGGLYQNPFGGLLGGYGQTSGGFNPYGAMEQFNPFGMGQMIFNNPAPQMPNFSQGLYGMSLGNQRPQLPLFNRNINYYLPFGANFQGNNRRFSFR